jgi:flavin-dependent dehydrogenase
MKTPVAIIGGGPGGSASAMFLLREGIKPVIIEKTSFPRYHIGESMSGECGAVLRVLGLEPDMLSRRHPIKHGLHVFGQAKGSWWVPVMARGDDGNLQFQSTWQVPRAEFDQALQDEAVARGATLIQGRATKPLLGDDGAVRGVEVRMADGGTLEIESELLLDCSGQATFLANAGVTGPKYLGSYDKQIAIFSQIKGGIRDAGGTREAAPGNTLIFYKKKYHWAWWIPIDDETTSVGIVCPAAYFVEQKESKTAFITRELHELHPELKRRIPEVKLVEEARAIPNYSYQVRGFCGKGFLCIGDAHRFIDPIFSFGLFIAVKEAQRVAPLVKAYLEGANRGTVNPFADYQLACEHGLDVLEDTIDAFWERPMAFGMLSHLRYRDQIIDVFAGRIYDNQPSPIVTDFRKILKRERNYDRDLDNYSVPIGSRFRAERAPLWEEQPSIF